MAFYPYFTLLILASAMPYDVFLSFRGEDTRKSFTDHLYKAMIQAGIHTFRDDDGILRGENIEFVINKTIYESKIAVIVFSKGYASSKWCLTELVIIMDRRRTAGLIVLPVFYHVDPSEVGEQTRRYGQAFATHEKHFKDEIYMVEQWRAALKEAADLAGMVLGERYESEFIQNIINEVENKLNHKVPSVNLYYSWNRFLLKLISFFPFVTLVLKNWTCYFGMAALLGILVLQRSPFNTRNLCYNVISLMDYVLSVSVPVLSASDRTFFIFIFIPIFIRAFLFFLFFFFFFHFKLMGFWVSSPSLVKVLTSVDIYQKDREIFSLGPPRTRNLGSAKKPIQRQKCSRVT